MPPGFIEGVVFAIWLVYVVVKDFGIPLVRAISDRKKSKIETVQSPECPYIEPVKTKVIALELNYTQQTARIADLADIIKEQRQAAEDAAIISDNKLDMVLAEVKEFRESIEMRIGKVIERLAITETNVAHLLANQQRRRGNGD